MITRRWRCVVKPFESQSAHPSSASVQQVFGGSYIFSIHHQSSQSINHRNITAPPTSMTYLFTHLSRIKHLRGAIFFTESWSRHDAQLAILVVVACLMMMMWWLQYYYEFHADIVMLLSYLCSYLGTTQGVEKIYIYIILRELRNHRQQIVTIIITSSSSSHQAIGQG